MLNQQTRFEQISIGKQQFMVVQKTVNYSDVSYTNKNTREFKTLRYKKPITKDWENLSDEEETKIEEVYLAPKPEKIITKAPQIQPKDATINIPLIKPKPRLSHKSQEYTHFLSIPLNDEMMKQKLEGFKLKIGKLNSSLPKFFVDFNKIHLTICMLTLDTPALL